MGIYGRDYMRDRPSPGFSLRHRGTTTWLLIVLVVSWFVHAVVVGPRGSSTSTSRFIWDVLLLHPEDVFGRWRLWQPFTAIWFHAPRTPWPLIVNLVALFGFGRMAEERLGSRGTFTLFVLAGVVGMGATCALTLAGAFGGTAVVAYGASAAILGLAAFVASRTPHLSVDFLLFRLPLWATVLVFLAAVEVPGLLAGRFAPATAGHLAGAAYGWAHGRWFAAGKPSGGGGLLARFRRAPAPEVPDFLPPPSPVELRERVEALLDRISRDGIGSLTDAEKDFLAEASRKYPRS